MRKILKYSLIRTFTQSFKPLPYFKPFNNTYPLFTSTHRFYNTTQQEVEELPHFVQTVPTPNPEAMKFFPGRPVLEYGTMNFPTALDAYCSPLAKSIFMVEGVKSVFLALDYITVVKEPEANWGVVETEVIEAIKKFYRSGRKVLTLDVKPTPDKHDVDEEEDEVIAAIKDMLDTRIRPMVQEDGGDVIFEKFEDGVVYVKLIGSCTGCPSSTATLKGGIENMLMHYIPEVEAVESIDESESEESKQMLEMTERQILEREKHAKALERLDEKRKRDAEKEKQEDLEKEKAKHAKELELESRRLAEFNPERHWR